MTPRAANVTRAPHDTCVADILPTTTSRHFALPSRFPPTHGAVWHSFYNTMPVSALLWTTLPGRRCPATTLYVPTTTFSNLHFPAFSIPYGMRPADGRRCYSCTAGARRTRRLCRNLFAHHLPRFGMAPPYHHAAIPVHLPAPASLRHAFLDSVFATALT